VKAHIGFDVKDWSSFLNTLDNQDFPLVGDESFFKVLEEMRSRMEKIREAVVPMKRWTKIKQRFVAIKIAGTWNHIKMCKNCTTLFITKEPVELRRCFACGGGMRNAKK